MTMTLYSGITIFYICLIIVTTYVSIIKHKHKSIKLFGINPDIIFPITVLFTMIYCFITAVAIEYLEFVWTNFIFVLCVIGAALFAFFLCSGFKKTISEKMKLLSIDETIESLKEKKLNIESSIIELAKIRDNGANSAETRNRASDKISELHIIRDKYNETLSELMMQKTLFEAEIDSDCIEAIQLTSSKSVKDKLNLNIDKFDSMENLEDSLSDVRSLMKNYK